MEKASKAQQRNMQPLASINGDQSARKVIFWVHQKIKQTAFQLVTQLNIVMRLPFLNTGIELG